MNPKFCPSCGREPEELFNGLCRRCFAGKAKLLEVPDKIEIAYCPCGRINAGKRWGHYKTVGAAVKEAVLSRSRALSGAKLSAEFRAPRALEKARISVTVRAEADIRGKTVSESKEVFAFLTQKPCEACAKRRAGYYEAIIQVRGNRKAELLACLRSELESLFPDDESAYISKIEESKGGFDVYVGGKAPSRKAAEKAKKIYNADTKKSYKIIGRKGGKSLSRETILLRAKEAI